MKRAAVLTWCLLAAGSAQAGWLFGDRIAVAPVEGANVFQHLDATGRKSLAVSGDIVAAVWEDNRSGSPQAYVAFKSGDQNKFSPATPISSGKSAFAPTVVALSDGRFLAGWEQDENVWVRTLTPQGSGPVVKLGKNGSTQIALGTRDGKTVFAAWCERHGEFNRIMAQELKIDGGRVQRHGQAHSVDRKPPKADQSYPSVAVTADGAVIAWEDRRHQHTILLYSHAERGGAFSPPRELNEVIKKSQRYGRGNGVTRVALTAYGDRNVVATWMDKRGEMTGYDIYAAFSHDGGRRFEKNEMVQDEFADNFTQWHPAVAADRDGRIAVAWDDDRDEVLTIFVAWKKPNGWSENLTPPPVSAGEGEKTNPVIALDARGILHLMWLEKATPESPGRVLYASAHPESEVAHTR